MKNTKIKTLAEEIASIFEALQEKTYQGSNRFVLEANREVGEKLNREFLGGVESAKGRVKMKELSEEISKLVPTGFSKRTLYYALKFYQNYKNTKLDYRLSWSHYRILSSVSNAAIRKQLEKQSISEEWTRTILERKARESGYYGGLKKIAFRRPDESRVFHYRVVSDKLNLKGPKLLDFGFHFYKRLETKFQFKEGDILELVSSDSKWNYKKRESVSASSLYHYLGKIERVIDGDTILACLNLGFGLILRERIRLIGVNAPELGTSDGEFAFQSLKKRLQAGTSLLVKTHFQDKYGRYLGDVLYLNGRDVGTERLSEKGIYLNEELVMYGY
ncbi:DUF1016 N-terminal domain-containing protein [Leptospira yasudae]|uniref:DUF1016 N-terminal domain-containing protein n=1 Tax=Leptospira yasudae TaxID=2202201 RepID=UPI0010917851|nr:DUF1016 N-terminal domain-containing protein [Leptospira yasudae]TGM98342.1 DUF1016 family protein [Leptospira yasudae]